jgi:hypothetical protein
MQCAASEAVVLMMSVSVVVDFEEPRCRRSAGYHISKVDVDNTHSSMNRSIYG